MKILNLGDVSRRNWESAVSDPMKLIDYLNKIMIIIGKMMNKGMILLNLNFKNTVFRLKMFSEIAQGSVATYHPNKYSKHQYELHRAFKTEKINQLTKSISTYEKNVPIYYDPTVYLTSRPDSFINHVPMSKTDRSDCWNQFTGGRLFDLQKTVHRISPPWVEAISVGARETAKLIYKSMRLTGRITKITVPEVYSQSSKLGTELIGTIVIRHTMTDPSGKVSNQNVNSR